MYRYIGHVLHNYVLAADWLKWPDVQQWNEVSKQAYLHGYSLNPYKYRTWILPHYVYKYRA